MHNKRIIASENQEYKRHNFWKQKDRGTFEMYLGPKKQTEADHEFEFILKTTRKALNNYVACFADVTAFLKNYICCDIFKGRLIFTVDKTDKTNQVILLNLNFSKREAREMGFFSNLFSGGLYSISAERY